jgi:hypothetical protein
MDYVTIISLVLAVLVGAGLYWVVSTKYLSFVEKYVRLAAGYLVTYQDALIAQFGQETYNEMKDLIDTAETDLADGKVTIPETIDAVKKAWPLAYKIVRYVSKKLVGKQA